MNKKSILIVLLIVTLAGIFRFYGVNWDQNQHLHPDERFLTMVSTSIQWPTSVSEYFDTNSSPLNPHNKDFPFFVYGTFPIFFTKYVAELFKLGDYQNLTLIGRQLSGFFDIGTAILVFFIAKEILAPKKSDEEIFPYFAMFFYTCMVLPIQLAHFFAVDTYLTFFLTFSFFIFAKIMTLNESVSFKKYLLYGVLLGTSFGLAVASKISAVLFLPILGLGIITTLIKSREKLSLLHVIFFLSSLLATSYITIRLVQPYLFSSENLLDITPNQKVIENWKTLESYNDKSGWFPPAVQWITTKPYIFPLKNLILWGIGLPLGLIFTGSVVYMFFLMIRNSIEIVREKNLKNMNISFLLLGLTLLWIFFLFGYQGMQFVKAMRYFLPIYPFIALISAWTVTKAIMKIQNPIKRTALITILIILILIYPISFVTIYTKPHTRIQASSWIYENIPQGSIIANEYWDDPLPLYLPGKNPGSYEGIMLPLYDEDNEEKWRKVSEDLTRADYIVLSSNRLYGSILTVPEKYPRTSKYYQDLFNGSLGFKKIAEFTSRPNILVPFLDICLTPLGVRYGIVSKQTQECEQEGVSFVDDYADESFTVYDHPKVIIFKKNKSVK